MAKIDKDFIPITPNNKVRRIKDVEIKMVFNHDDDYEEILSLKFIDEKIDELNRKINKLRDNIAEYNRLRILVEMEAKNVQLKTENKSENRNRNKKINPHKGEKNV